MPRHSLGWVGIEAATAHDPIGGITHHGTKKSDWEKIPGLTNVSPEKSYLMFQAISHHILAGSSQECSLQFEPNDSCVREAPRQK
jgi:hypothetical protein